MDLDSFIYYIIEVQTGARMGKDPPALRKRPSEIISRVRAKQKDIRLRTARFLNEPKEKIDDINKSHDDYIKNSKKASRYLKQPEMKERSRKIYPYGG